MLRHSTGWCSHRKLGIPVLPSPPRRRRSRRCIYLFQQTPCRWSGRPLSLPRQTGGHWRKNMISYSRQRKQCCKLRGCYRRTSTPGTVRFDTCFQRIFLVLPDGSIPCHRTTLLHPRLLVGKALGWIAIRQQLPNRKNFSDRNLYSCSRVLLLLLSSSSSLSSPSLL